MRKVFLFLLPLVGSYAPGFSSGAEAQVEIHENHYEQLPISGEDRQMIGKILITMAENNVFSLLLEKKKLERIGERINHVHPMRFLGTVFSDPNLVHCLKKIRRSSFKWDGFIEGFGERMREEGRAGNLARYVPGFAQVVKRDPSSLMYFIDSTDFEGLVNFLLSK